MPSKISVRHRDAKIVETPDCPRAAPRPCWLSSSLVTGNGFATDVVLCRAVPAVEQAEVYMVTAIWYMLLIIRLSCAIYHEFWMRAVYAYRFGGTRLTASRVHQNVLRRGWGVGDRLCLGNKVYASSPFSVQVLGQTMPHRSKDSICLLPVSPRVRFFPGRSGR